MPKLDELADPLQAEFKRFGLLIGIKATELKSINAHTEMNVREVGTKDLIEELMRFILAVRSVERYGRLNHTKIITQWSDKGEQAS
tara:strand:- start:320 stop:577 length:258 start_codon:yes stop_codon:yes gene_type:complete